MPIQKTVAVLRRRVLLRLLVPFTSSCLQAAQTDTRFSVTVRVVNLLATVRDGQGHYVTNLRKDDFVLREDGRPQTISYFSAETHLPLTLGLLIDQSRSQRSVDREQRKLATSILGHILRQRADRGFVLTFDRAVQLRQHLTSQRKLLVSAVKELRAVSAYPPPLDAPVTVADDKCRCTVAQEATRLYDAIQLSSGQIMQFRKPQKTLIVLTDGIDFGSNATLKEAITAAQRADVAVYAVQFFDAATYQRNAAFYSRIGTREASGLVNRPSAAGLLEDGRATLRRIAEETGGAFFQVSGKDTTERISAMIQTELSNSYSIGYSPDVPPTGGRYRRIALDTKHKGLIVRTRDGYYPAL
jgi:VWFA-related protein